MTKDKTEKYETFGKRERKVRDRNLTKEIYLD